MPFADFLISLRERLLDIVSGSDRAKTLNQVVTPNVRSIDGDPAAELVDLLREVLSRGLVDDGRKVDYAALLGSICTTHLCWTE